MNKTKKTKQAFIIEQLKPYFLDPTTCGYEEGDCVFKAKNGNMCVLGKNMLLPHVWESTSNMYEIFGNDPQSKVLKPNAVDILTDVEWGQMQTVHDLIAEGHYFSLKKNVKHLETVTNTDLSELHDLASNFIQ